MARPNFDDFNADFASPSQWAVMYRHYGLQIIPGYMPGESKSWKRPHLAEWVPLQETLVSEATFRRWYDQQTGEYRTRRNMGIITGRCSDGAFIIDLDIHKKPEAALWWRGVCAVHNNGMVPETPTQQTGGGGLQLLFGAPPGWTPPTNKTDIGVDLRGQAGFAVMPSSLHDSGKAYEWLPGRAPWEIPILEAPAWLCEEIDKLVGAQPGNIKSTQVDLSYQNAANLTAKTTSGGDFDAFGGRIDGREGAMRDMVWRCVVKLYRQCPIMPNEVEQSAMIMAEYEIYERTVSVQNPFPHELKADGLDRENRGLRAFAAKWQYAMRQWDTDVAAAAAEPDPHPDPTEWVSASTAYSAAPSTPTGQSLPLLLSSAQFVAGFTPPSYLIDGILQRGYLYSLTARTNHGKTAVSMYIAQCIARGEPMHGREVLSGTVLMLAGENPDDIRARFLVLAEAYGFNPETIKIRFIAGVVSLIDKMPQIRHEAEQIEDLVLVLVDTAAAYFPGDEANSNTQQGAYARVLRTLTTLRGMPCVVANCHPIKNASRENLLPMGGSAFVNEVDGNLTLWANTEKQTSLHWQGKFRGPEFEPLSFELRGAESQRVQDAKGRLMPSVVAVVISEMTLEASEVTQERSENTLLEALHANPQASFSMLAVRCGFMLNNRPQKYRVQRMIQRMSEDKLVAKHRGGKYRLTAKGRREIGIENDE